LNVETNTTATAEGLNIHQHNATQKRRWEELKEQATAHRAEGSEILATRCERQMHRIEEDIVRKNRGLTVGLARRFAVGRAAADGDDYVSVASTALWQAFKEWDPAKGALSTFAVPYIKGAVQRTVHKTEAHEISYGDWTAGPKVRAAVTALERKHGRPPTMTEIAEATGETVTLVQRVLMTRPTSLDAPVGDGESKRGDLVSTGASDMFDVAFASAEDPFEMLECVADSLDDRELFVVARRFGLDGGRTQSLNEIGQVLGTSREAIRRTEASAKKKLEFRLG
jgi:RNA polymerase sigma factor (sigma-70 family)